MTDKAFPRPKFDRELVYIINRHLQLNGETLAPGAVFDKALVNDRKLRQLYDQRFLRFAEPDEIPARKVRGPRPRPGARIGVR